jgi:hypothetical protein
VKVRYWAKQGDPVWEKPVFRGLALRAWMHASSECRKYNMLYWHEEDGPAAPQCTQAMRTESLNHSLGRFSIILFLLILRTRKKTRKKIDPSYRSTSLIYCRPSIKKSWKFSHSSLSINEQIIELICDFNSKD